MWKPLRFIGHFYRDIGWDGRSMLFLILIGVILLIVGKYSRREPNSLCPTLETRIQKLTNALGDAVSLIGEVESEISERTGLASKLKADVDRYEKIKSLKPEEVEAVAQTLREEIRTGNKGGFWISTLASILGGLVIFLFGMVIGRFGERRRAIAASQDP